MDVFKLVCKCGGVHEIPVKYAGHSIKCTRCGRFFRAPDKNGNELPERRDHVERRSAERRSGYDRRRRKADVPRERRSGDRRKVRGRRTGERRTVYISPGMEKTQYESRIFKFQVKVKPSVKCPGKTLDYSGRTFVHVNLGEGTAHILVSLGKRPEKAGKQKLYLHEAAKFLYNGRKIALQVPMHSRLVWIGFEDETSTGLLKAKLAKVLEVKPRKSLL